MDMRDFVTEPGTGEYRLYPYAMDLHYNHNQNILSMKIQMFDDKNTHEFSFGFKPSAQLQRFLQRTVGDEE